MAVLPITGWEPHRAVEWAARAHERGLDNLRCLVFGREPITSSEIWLDGNVGSTAGCVQRRIAGAAAWG
jgi:hypothetical protein